ncbi:hypothetical protein F4861DRAFT_542213 [Xylaria intraflava]|nr:hypothetical protein F4861DRAFT_542213 [Xylaria intraflava]
MTISQSAVLVTWHSCSDIQVIIGSFFDAEDRELWRIEIFLAYGSDEDLVSEPDSDTDAESSEVITETDRSDDASTIDEDPKYTEDGYILLDVGNHTNVNSNPPSHHVNPCPPPYQVDTVARIGSSLGYIPPFPYPPAMASQFPARGGWNPRFGWDGQCGPPVNPPSGPYGYQGAYNLPAYTSPQYSSYYGANSMPGYRLPQPHPRVSTDVPGMNMVNSTGGAGCEPGYNYIFHDEHTKIHIFKTSEPPWRAPRMNYDFAKFQVPTNTTLAELFVRFGAVNPNPGLNRVTEVIEGGGGKWYRGMIFTGDNFADMSKTLKDIGWDSSRSGREKAVVWLWITKD